MASQRHQQDEERHSAGAVLGAVSRGNFPIVADYIVVGSGLTGATIARLLSDAGREVLVLDRRSHIGGNVFDEVHALSRIRMNRYGPHYLRSNSDRIWDFIQRFAEIRPWEARVYTWLDGEPEIWPLRADYIARLVGSSWEPGFTGDPKNFEEAALSMMPQRLYERAIGPYSTKQWGCDPRFLSAALAKRFDVRAGENPRFSEHKHQGLPVGGFTQMVRQMLEGVAVMLGVDFLDCRDDFHARKKLIFTGPIDEFYGFDLGKLQYRGQHREHTWLPIKGYAMPCGQVNTPQHESGGQVRVIEWKHMLDEVEASAACGTMLTHETPCSPVSPDAYEYPFPDAVNAELYGKYRARADADPRLLVCGRLGENRYLDMDMAIARAMTLADQLLNNN